MSNNKFNYLELHLVDHCNLNCAHCSHYAPLAKPKFIADSQFYKTIDRLATLLKNTNGRFTLRLLGGEPLLHPNIEAYLKYARNKLQKVEIVIVSNCLELKTERGLAIIQAIKKNNIKVQYTNYAGSPNFNDPIILKLLETTDYYKLDHSGFFNTNLDFYHTHDGNAMYNKCSNNGTFICLILKDNYLYKCAIEAYNDILFDKFNVRPQNNYNKLDNVLDFFTASVEDINKFIEEPSSFCKYCSWECTKYTAWRKSNKIPAEWLTTY